MLNFFDFETGELFNSVPGTQQGLSGWNPVDTDCFITIEKSNHRNDQRRLLCQTSPFGRFFFLTFKKAKKSDPPTFLKFKCFAEKLTVQKL